MLEWLNGPPTKPGYYWWCWMHDSEGSLRMCQVYLLGDKLVAETDGPVPVTKPMRYWAGPLPDPEGRPKPRKKPWT